jgi:co-chaperonin GroES (HSP10)
MRGTALSHTAIAFVGPNERIRPLRDVIIVKPIDPHFSDVLSVHWRGKPVKGTVIAAGPGTYPWKHTRGKREGKDFHEIRQSAQFMPTEVKAGDVVELGGLEREGYAFQTVIVDGVECVIATEKDVCGVHV